MGGVGRVPLPPCFFWEKGAIAVGLTGTAIPIARPAPRQEECGRRGSDLGHMYHSGLVWISNS